jgi:hypothetical protein
MFMPSSALAARAGAGDRRADQPTVAPRVTRRTSGRPLRPAPPPLHLGADMNGAAHGLRQVLGDIRNRRHLEAYCLFLIVLVLTIVNLFGELPNQVVYSAILASLALLIYSSVQASSQPWPSIDAFLLNRERMQPLPELLAGATEFWMYAPTAINTIPRFAGDIKTDILESGGRVKIVVMDPASPHLSTLEDQISRSGADASAALSASLSVLTKMRSWGSIEYRLLDFNPGFNLVVVDPKSKSGRVLIEFHGFRDDNVSDRMHIIIHRSDSLHWFDYWVQRFEAIWEAAHESSA